MQADQIDYIPQQVEVSWLDLPLAASPWPVQLVIISLLAALGACMVWKLIVWQRSSVGLEFKRDIWPVLKQNPMAVALWCLGIYGMFTFIAVTLLGRFA